MTEQKATNVTWEQGSVEREQRHELLGQKGATLWFTGLSGSGKSTISAALEAALVHRGRPAYRLDGDNVRHGVNKNLGFAPEDRAENIRRVGEISKLFADSGMIALASFISPYRADRELCRSMHEEAGLSFIEVFVDCPLEEAERRDPKGLYKKARAGLVKDFTGVDAPYEAPLEADVHLRTDQLSVVAEVATLLTALERLAVIPTVALPNTPLGAAHYSI
jgi:adenylylsulfate kinase